LKKNLNSELENFLKKYPKTRYVDAIITDLSGIIRGKRYPIEEAKKLYTEGVQVPTSVFLLDVLGDSSDPLGWGFGDGDPDSNCFAIPNTLTQIPWNNENLAQVLLEMKDEHGKPQMIDPRNILENIEKTMKKSGLNPVVAFELEFYLFDKKRKNGRPLVAKSQITGERTAKTQVYSIEDLDEFSPFLRDIENFSKSQNIPASVISSEYAAGQFEVNLRHCSSATKAADDAALLKRLIKGTAQKHGFVASFMAKPLLDSTGNGMHVHISIEDKKGKNIFTNENIDKNKNLKFAIGGLLKTMYESFAMFAPNINSYRRFLPRQFVPVNRSWGFNNRSVAFRIPAGNKKNMRIEHRIAGADANPYLVLSCILAGIHHGLKNKILPGIQAKGNVSNRVDPKQPTNLLKAIENLKKSKTLKYYLTKYYIDLYSVVKKNEHEKFNSFISSEEYDWYI